MNCMNKFLCSTLFLLAAFLSKGQKNSVYSNPQCKFIIDSLTGKVVFITADSQPVNDQGGKPALIKRLQQLDFTNDSSIFAGTIILSFIVDTAGIISGERIRCSGYNLGNEYISNQIGNEILAIIKSFNWKPATCNGKKVSMLYSQSMHVDPAEQ